MTPASPVSVEERDELIRLRRDFHRHPELGYQEKRTAGIVAARMRELGLEVREGVAQTGVLASRGAGDRSLLVRADMDALPIQEEGEVEYKSTRDGVMHACGHDGHTAIGMMVAARFARAEFPGRIRFAFQPAEEGGQGADRMIDDGALEGVDAALGLHLWNYLPVGRVAVTTGPTMAAVDDFTIEVRGEGGHAAMPHETDDPIVAAAGIVREVQTIVSRRVDPFETAVVSITSIQGGDAFNVIPDRVTMRGTVRSFQPEVRDEVHRRLHEIVGRRGSLQLNSITRTLVNDQRMCEIVEHAAAEVVGEKNIVRGIRTMGGEDFASVLAQVPGCFFFVGSESPQGSHPHHNPRFDIDERALELGLEIMTRASWAFLKNGFV